jgi:SNF2 family DNA or RNA helicase
MRTPSDLHAYQQKAVEFQCSRPASALWLDPGLGKTAATLTSVNYLLQVQHLRAVLVVAPIRVCRLVWRQEAARWSHTQDMTFGMVMGTRDQRTRSLLQDKNVFLINYENLGWLAEALHTYYIKKGKPLPFDGVVFEHPSLLKILQLLLTS